MKFEGNFDPNPSTKEIKKALKEIEQRTAEEESAILKSGLNPEDFEQKRRNGEFEEKIEKASRFDFWKMKSFLFRNSKETLEDKMLGLDNTKIIDNSGLDMDKNSILNVLSKLKNKINGDYYNKKYIPIFDDIKDVKKIEIDYSDDKKISFVIYFYKKYLFSKKTLEILKFEIDDELNITIPHTRD